jgi:hypothetical protein
MNEVVGKGQLPTMDNLKKEIYTRRLLLKY